MLITGNVRLQEQILALEDQVRKTRQNAEELGATEMIETVGRANPTPYVLILKFLTFLP